MNNDSTPTRPDSDGGPAGPLPATIVPAIEFGEPFGVEIPSVSAPEPGNQEPTPRRYRRRLSGMFDVDSRSLASISLPGKSVTVGASSTKVLDKNDARIFGIIVNDSTNVVYLSFGDTPAVASSGIRLNASGGSIVFGLGTDIPYTGAVYAIASGSSVVTVVES